MHLFSSQKGEIVTAVAVATFILLSVATLAISSVTQSDNRPITTALHAQSREIQQCSDWCATALQCSSAGGKTVSRACTFDRCVSGTAPCVVGEPAQTGGECSDWCATENECNVTGGKKVTRACSFAYCRAGTNPCLVSNSPQTEGPRSEQPQRPPAERNGDETVDGVPLSNEQSPNECKPGATKGWYCERNQPGINGEPAPNCVRVYWNKSCGDYYQTDNARGCCRVEGRTPTVAPQPDPQPSSSGQQPTSAAEPTQSPSQKCTARNLMVGSQCASTCTQADKRCQMVSDGCWRCIPRNNAPTAIPTATPDNEAQEEDETPQDTEENAERLPEPADETDQEPDSDTEEEQEAAPDEQSEPEAEAEQEPEEDQNSEEDQNPAPEEDPENTTTPTRTPRCATGYSFEDEDICIGECGTRCESSTSNAGKRCFRCPVNPSTPVPTLTPMLSRTPTLTRTPTPRPNQTATPAQNPSATPTREPLGPDQLSPTPVPTGSTDNRNATCKWIPQCDQNHNFLIGYAEKEIPYVWNNKEYYASMEECNQSKNILPVCEGCNYLNIQQWCSDKVRKIIVNYTVTIPAGLQYDNVPMELSFRTGDLFSINKDFCKKTIAVDSISSRVITEQCVLNEKIAPPIDDGSFYATLIYTHNGTKRFLRSSAVSINWKVSPASLNFNQVLSVN